MNTAGSSGSFLSCSVHLPIALLVTIITGLFVIGFGFRATGVGQTLSSSFLPETRSETTQIPPNATWVSNWAALRTAMGNSSVSYIAFSNNIQRSGGTGAGEDLPVVTRDLTINGNGFVLDGRNGGAATSINRNLLRMGPSSVQRNFTVIDLDIIRPPSSGNPAIAFVTGTGNTASSASTARNEGSYFWTLNLHNVSAVGTSPSGFITMSDGIVNFWGSNSWDMNENSLLINARDINFLGGSSDFSNQNSGRGAQILTFNPRTAARDSSLTAGGGAQVTMMSRSADQVLYADIAGRVSIELSEAALLDIEGHGSGTGADGAVVVLNSDSGGFSVKDGSVFRVYSTSVGVGQPAIVQQIPGGRFIVDGEDSLVDLQSWGADNRYGATLRFRRDGDQQFLVSNGARVNIIRHNTGTRDDPAALRFGNGDDNYFQVTGGAQVRIENFGSTRSIQDPGTTGSNGFDAAIEYNSAGFGFTIEGYRSAVELIAHGGAALNARNHRNGTISVTDGAIFLARGITDSATASIFRASGGNVHFFMDSPLYYDFVNTRPGGGAIFNLGTGANNSFTSNNSDVSVWRRGINRWQGNPDSSWTLIDYVLSGSNLRQVSSNDPSFAHYYNAGANNSTRIENYTRISGNNATPEVRDMLDLTNADRYVRALAAVPEGLDFIGRPLWTGEGWGSFTRTPADGSPQQEIRSSGSFADSLVRSYFEETLFEQQQNLRTIAGSLQMRTADGSFLIAGDSYTLTELWRSDSADNPKRHVGTEGLPMSRTVADVVPPVPAEVDYPVVQEWETTFSGSWSLADGADNGPALGAAGISAYLLSGTNPAIPLPGTGVVKADNSWTYEIAPGLLQAGDIIMIALIDDQGNENPLTDTAFRDRVFPAATPILVAPPGQIPYRVYYFFNGVEDRTLRHIATITDPGPGNSVPVTIGIDFPHAPQQMLLGWRLDRSEPAMPAPIDRDNTVINIFYVHDEEQVALIDVQYFFDGEHDHAFDRTIDPHILSTVHPVHVALDASEIARGFIPAASNHIVPALPQRALDLSGSTIQVFYETTQVELTISKEVVGVLANPDRTFAFSIFFTDHKGTPLPAGTSFDYLLESAQYGQAGTEVGTLVLAGPQQGLAGGRGSFTLGHHDEITLMGIRSNYTLHIIEEAAAGYVTTFVDSYYPEISVESTDTGLRDMHDQSRSFAFRNTVPPEDVIPSGLFAGNTLVKAILLVIAATAASMLALPAIPSRRGGQTT